MLFVIRSRHLTTQLSMPKKLVPYREKKFIAIYDYILFKTSSPHIFSEWAIGLLTYIFKDILYTRQITFDHTFCVSFHIHEAMSESGLGNLGNM